MQKRKSQFERVPLHEVKRILEEQKNAAPEGEKLADSQERFNSGRANNTASAKNVQKHRARPKRSIRTEGQDHPLGLWINKEIFRKHQNRAPQIVLHDPSVSTNDHYLGLADMALGNNRTKSKTKPNDADLMEEV